GPALAHGVEMAAGDHAGLAGGVAPPGPLVAVAVLGQVQAPARGLAREPVAQFEIRVRPGVPDVSTGGGVAPHVRECVEHGHTVTLMNGSIHVTGPALGRMVSSVRWASG